MRFVVCALLCAAAAGLSSPVHVDCNGGSDYGLGTQASPFRSVHKAQEALRLHRTKQGVATPYRVQITGLCELAVPLILNSNLDGNVVYSGVAGAILSGGTQIAADIHNTNTVQTVDLGKYNFTDLGKLTGRGYSGGSACILVNNFQESAAELFFRPGITLSGC